MADANSRSGARAETMATRFYWLSSHPPGPNPSLAWGEPAAIVCGKGIVMLCVVEGDYARPKA